jgi:uncharacterized protein (DUF952 family)
MDDRLYKICPGEAWRKAQVDGALAPSAADARDGYVHLSAAHQVRATAAKHFARQEDLVLLVVAADRLPAGALRWEISRGGDRFPHLYDGPLRPAQVARAVPLPLDERGVHRFPGDVP